MAVERSEGQQGLVRRVGVRAKVAFDDSASGSQRAGAGALIAGLAAGSIAGGFGVIEGIDKLVIENPVVSTLLGTEAAHVGGVGAAVGLGVGIVTWYGGAVRENNRTHDDPKAFNAGHVALGNVRIASFIAAGTFGLLAAGLGVADSAHLLNMPGLDGGLTDTASLLGGIGATLSAARLVSRRGALKPERQLAE